MKTIRKGIFQTNSSSTHAISICYDDDIAFTTIYPQKYDDTGEYHIVIGSENIGYIGDDIYSDTKTKATYLAGCINSLSDKEWQKSRELFNILKQVISEHCCVKIENISISDGIHVESEDARSMINFICENHKDIELKKKQFKYFIFHPKSFVESRDRDQYELISNGDSYRLEQRIDYDGFY